MKRNLEIDNLTGINHDGSTTNWPVKFLTATSIIGDDVENNKGESLGKINNIMLNIKSGAVEYVILESGGILGLGSKLFAIPFNELKLVQERKLFRLDKEKDYLVNAPGFDKQHWPETNAHLNEVNSYWGDFMGGNIGSM